MKFAIYKVLVVVGAALAVLLAYLRHGAPGSADTLQLAMLEATSFGLCVAGIIIGGRAHRRKYRGLGLSKATARVIPTFMKERAGLQVTALMAGAAIASLAASRIDLNPFYAGTAVLAATALAIPVANSLSGWTRKA